jgi:hypothetical protein
MIIKLENGARIPFTELVTLNIELLKFKSVLDQFEKKIIFPISELENKLEDMELSEFKSKFKKDHKTLNQLGDEIERYCKFSEEFWKTLLTREFPIKRRKD